MDLPGIATRIARPHETLASLAGFIRDCLAELSRRGRPPEQAATVIVAAAAPFAPTSFARARLLRQMHACGLLSGADTERVEDLLAVGQ